MSRGFTLIEMVITIVLLGIVGLFLGNVLGQAMGIYADSTAREALIQQGRFLTERMSRELREAVPNSVMVTNRCIEFLPIVNSALYQSLPSDPINTLRLLPIRKSIQAGERLVVSPSNPLVLRATALPVVGQVAEVATSVMFTPQNNQTMVDVALSQATQFTVSSPAQRVYFYQRPVAYCYSQEDKSIYRYSEYNLDRVALFPNYLGEGVLMAEQVIDVEFIITEPQLQRNGLVKIGLTFADKGEQVRFEHDALVYNTP